MKNSIFFFLILFISINISAQELDQFINYKSALKKETRSLTGTPGKYYWQNRADYKISASLDPAQRRVSGSADITYLNLSPDSLDQVVIKLYQNIFKKGGIRDFSINPNDITNGVEIKSVAVNGKEMKLDGGTSSPKLDNTNYIIPLKNKLAIRENVKLKIDWSFVLPKESNIRMGSYGSSFFVAYWFPQIAVYDDIDGWDTNQYTGHTETYNDFSYYDVEITVPKGYLVWATGELQNPGEVLSEKIYNKYISAQSSDKIINIVTEADYQSGLITADNEKLVWKFKANYVPDFTFAASDNYLWDGSSLIVEQSSGRRAFIDAAYNKQSKEFSQVADIARKSINSFSTHLPGIPYPYPKMTIFNGEGGMEFPMMVNNSNVKNLQGTVHLTSHEIFHTYFPFFMGINERKYAWMDEGWAVMMPCDFQAEHAPGYDPVSRNAKSYSEFAGFDTDVAPMVPSHQLRSPSYRTASYRRAGAAYQTLRDYLGDDLFKRALHLYIFRWNGKHPVPYDFFYTFNEVCEENLNWFWTPWFFENKYPDLSLKSEKGNGEEILLTVKNTGGIPLPVKIKAYYSDGSYEYIINEKASVWKNSSELSRSIKPKSRIIKFELGAPQIPDVDLQNNIAVIK
jgi:hypothetical protein